MTTKSMRTTSVLLAALLALLTVTSGCTSDSVAICERRKECYTSTLDVDDCASSVDNYADDSSTNEGRVTDCARCIEDKSCSEITANCLFGECLLLPGG